MLSAFYRLTSTRPLGMAGVGPIPWTAVQMWIDRDPRLVDKGDRRSFDYLIARLDAEDRKIMVESQPKE